MELPGVNPEDISLNHEPGRVAITVKEDSDTRFAGSTYTWDVPRNASDISADYQHGILIIRAGTEEPEPNEIPITVTG